MINAVQHKEAYSVGLDHYDGKFGITEARKRLANTGLNPNSATDLVYNLSHLLKGERYTRGLSLAVTDDYLTWIRRDKGDESLASAIQALGEHIKYYEAKRNIRLHKMREVMTKHQALLARPAISSILLEYDDSESRGYIDILPLELFAEEGIRHAIIHTVRQHRGKDYQAKCDITVRDLEADLDYQPYADFNTKQGMHLGVARLIFEDTDRTAILSVEWKSKISKAFARCPFKTPKFVVPPAPPYQPPAEPAGKIPRMVRERPGQAAFRRNLKFVYDNRCCISGCSIPEVLEG